MTRYCVVALTTPGDVQYVQPKEAGGFPQATYWIMPVTMRKAAWIPAGGLVNGQADDTARGVTHVMQSKR